MARRPRVRGAAPPLGPSTCPEGTSHTPGHSELRALPAHPAPGIPANTGPPPCTSGSEKAEGQEPRCGGVPLCVSALGGCAIVRERTGGACHFALVSPLGKEVTSGVPAAWQPTTGAPALGAGEQLPSRPSVTPSGRGPAQGAGKAGVSPSSPRWAPYWAKLPGDLSLTRRSPGKNLQVPHHPHMPPRAPCCSHRLRISSPESEIRAPSDEPPADLSRPSDPVPSHRPGCRIA